MINSIKQKSVHRTQLSRQIFLQYLFSLLVFLIGYFLLCVLIWNLYHLFIWQGDELLYPLFSWGRENFSAVSVFILALGTGGITYYCIAKPLGYLDELLGASAQLIRFADTPITLSPSLKTVEGELNLVREQALRNAMLAKEAEQRKNDLLVYLAHDLKTPLTSVLGYLTLLKDEPELSASMRARYTGIALDKAERLETLINEFFEITRFNLTALTLEPETIHLSRMLEQIACEFQPILHEKQLHWVLQIAPDLQFICDAEKLERVLDNLIRNAIHYSYAGTNIVLSLQQQQNGVQIQIENQGKTIPAEKLEHIFEQFFRLDAARTTTTGGAGLGLAIAKELVALHGGTIKAQSGQERIIFTVWLPQHR